MTVVYQAADPARAELVRGLLQAAGIPAEVVGAELSGVIGEIPFVRAFPKVVVPADRADEARALIRDSAIDASDRCVSCGYPLKDLTSNRCPECGEPFSKPPPAAKWICPNCGEECEGQFTACWQCGAERPDSSH
jgi:predicted RNA-binding Zn-ribbon protein involved in translation (DUF1610 family)